MVDGNGSNDDTEVKVKWCPFINEYCLKERCALHQELTKQIGGGLMQKFGMCAFNSMVIMLSEINMKTPGHHQNIQLPHLFKG